MKINFSKNHADHSVVDVEIKVPNGAVRHSEIRFATADEAKLFLREMRTWTANRCDCGCECGE